MILKRISYDDLSPRQQEIYNFQKVSSILADYGFNCIKLADDWQGADFLAYHKDEEKTLKVQLKGRVAIAKEYQGKNLYMVFPIDGSWYLIEHDKLIDLIAKVTSWLQSDSWKIRGRYSTPGPSKNLVELLQENRLEEIKD